MLQSTTASNPNATRTSILILLLILLLKILSPWLLIHPIYELHRDEYLYLDQAHHPAWGYVSVPPFTAWISVLIHWLGDSEFLVRLFPALWGAMTIAAAWTISLVLNGGFYAKALTAVALFFSVLLRMNILYQPNSFDILSWTLVYLFLILYIKQGAAKWLIWMAIIFALGFLNKYSILFLGASIFVGLLVSGPRKIFFKKHFYLSAGLCMLLILPNLVWQYNNGFPAVGHMKELAETQLANMPRSGFLKEQVLFFIPAFFVLTAAFAGFIFYRPFKAYRAVLYSYIACITLFVYFRAKGYYAIGLYPVLVAFGSVYLERLFTHGWKWYGRILSFILILLLFIPMLIAFPLIEPGTIRRNAALYEKFDLLKWEDGKNHALPQDIADMLGWKELAYKTDSVYSTLPANEFTLVRTDNYGQAGAINYFKQLNAVSYNADYLYWFNLDRPIINMIMVKESGDYNPAMEKESLLFEKIYLADSVSNEYARENGTRIYVLKNARQPINPLLIAEIDEIKKGKRNY